MIVILIIIMKLMMLIMIIMALVTSKTMATMHGSGAGINHDDEDALIMVVTRSYPSKFDFSRGDWKRLKKTSTI